MPHVKKTKFASVGKYVYIAQEMLSNGALMRIYSRALAARFREGTARGTLEGLARVVGKKIAKARRRSKVSGCGSEDAAKVQV